MQRTQIHPIDWVGGRTVASPPPPPGATKVEALKTLNANIRALEAELNGKYREMREQRQRTLGPWQHEEIECLYHMSREALTIEATLRQRKDERENLIYPKVDPLWMETAL